MSFVFFWRFYLTIQLKLYVNLGRNCVSMCSPVLQGLLEEGGYLEAQTVSKKIPWTFFCNIFKNKTKKLLNFQLQNLP